MRNEDMEVNMESMEFRSNRSETPGSSMVLFSSTLGSACKIPRCLPVRHHSFQFSNMVLSPSIFHRQHTSPPETGHTQQLTVEGHLHTGTADSLTVIWR